MAAIDIARDVIARGYKPVPVPIGKKNPVLRRWQHLDVTTANVDRYFSDPTHNCGVIMGPRSNGLTDADLDCVEAVLLAPYFLPQTGSVYGRASKRRSHYLYVITDPIAKASRKVTDEKNRVVVELRMGGGGKGAQSIFPGSVHKDTGERYEWDEDGEPARSTCATLMAAITKIGVATMLARKWPEGNRHERATRCGGLLARAGWTADEISAFIVAVQEVAGVTDPVHVENGRKAAIDAANHFVETGEGFGRPAFAEFFNEDVAKQVCKLIGYREATSATHTAADGFEVKRGQRVPSQGNIRLAMERLGISLRFDAFNDRMLIDGHAEEAGEAVVDDAIANQLWLRIEEEFGFRSTREYFYIVVEEAARRNTFHPVLDYLDGLEWDGTKRLDGWLTIYCGVTDTEYARAVGAITLIAAVRRVRRPGVKFDEMLVLEGPQGLNKSELLKALAVNPDWFSDDLPLNADGKRVIEQTRGKWIIEAAEMSGIRKTEVEHLKAMLSRQTDRGRLAYDRMTSEKNRQFIVFGTTNDATYLRDATGNRRFWPVRISGCNVDDLRADADQLWAEVAKREAAGASIRLHQSLWAAAAAEQAERVVDDPWFEIMAEVFGNLNGRVLAAELWRAVDVRAGDQDPGRNKRLGDVMRALGFERKKLRKSAGGWGYRRPPGDVPENKPWIEIAYDSPAMRWRAHVSDDGVADAAE